MKKLIVAVISTISLVSGSSNNVVKKKKSELNKWNKTECFLTPSNEGCSGGGNGDKA